jgi:transposase-like protein
LLVEDGGLAPFTATLTAPRDEERNMSMQTTQECPYCEAEQTFYLIASTELHLGRKTKWLCDECERNIVKIDGEVDTAADAAEI